MKKTIYAPLFLLTLALSAATVAAQMVSPSTDKTGEPFSYFSKPTDEIGIMDSEAATEVTPEGFLRTGFGELMFFTAPEYQPISARVRSLEEGHLPILSWTVTDGGVDYRFTVFGSTLAGKPGAPLVNFIRVAMRNSGGEPGRAKTVAKCKPYPQTNLFAAESFFRSDGIFYALPRTAIYGQVSPL